MRRLALLGDLVGALRELYGLMPDAETESDAGAAAAVAWRGKELSRLSPVASCCND